jgi:hypothetical protein
MKVNSCLMEKKKREVNNLFNILNYIHVDKQRYIKSDFMNIWRVIPVLSS